MVTEAPLFTVHLCHSETSGVAEGGKRQILAVKILLDDLEGNFWCLYVFVLQNFCAFVCFVLQQVWTSRQADSLLVEGTVSSPTRPAATVASSGM